MCQQGKAKNDGRHGDPGIDIRAGIGVAQADAIVHLALPMAPKMESMYEYDPVRKQYRRRGGDSAHPEGLPAPASAKGAGDIYDTRSGRGRPSIWGSSRSAPVPRPAYSMGKRLFWIAFTVVALGWITITVLLSRQHRENGEPFSLRKLFFDVKPPPLIPGTTP